jgi:hypothetical protein
VLLQEVAVLVVAQMARIQQLQITVLVDMVVVHQRLHLIQEEQVILPE